MATEVRKLSSGRQVYSDSKGEYVVVKNGDTLSKIAKEASGSPYNIKNYQQLATINKLSNPNLISNGQKIYLTTSSSGTNTKTSTNTNKPKITSFGELSTSNNTLFATWTWHKVSDTEKYKVVWTYDTGDGVWLQGNNSEITVDHSVESLSRQSTYSIPSGAKKVRFKVKPISKKKKKGNKEVDIFTAEWSETKTWTNDTPLDTPGVPTVTLDGLKLTAKLTNIKIVGATGIEFGILRVDDKSSVAKKKVGIVNGDAAHTFTVTAGEKFKVQCRAYKGSTYSEWSDWSETIETRPVTPSGITTIKATDSDKVYLKWGASKTAEAYEIQYTTKKENFDQTGDTTTVTVPESGEPIRTDWTVIGLATGSEYFFRVRAVKGSEKTPWTAIKSVILGIKPAAPTTWSSTTTTNLDETVNLYWIHNAQDGSGWKQAKLSLQFYDANDFLLNIEELTINNEAFSDENADENDKYKTGSYSLIFTDWTNHTSIRKVKWQVQTMGVLNEYGEYSTMREVTVYESPSLKLSILSADQTPITDITTFPFYIYGLPGPTTQTPIGYHLTITANKTYETTDDMGNELVVSSGDVVYSQYFDIRYELMVEMSPGNIDLQNDVDYTVTGIVSMDSGLTATDTAEFTVSWTDVEYAPNAEIGIDTDSYTATIRPYCEDRFMVYRRVNKTGSVYTLTDEEIEELYGEVVNRAVVASGEQVYLGTTATGEEVYYCIVEGSTPVTNVYLSVYRREFDGSFTELATGLDGENTTTITDPHPALDLARYRIVAKSKDTGAVSYFDPPGVPTGCYEIIIQWDEDWTSFDTTEDAELEQPAWTGSLLRLPYNIDVSDNAKCDVELVEYVGRSHPVSYYGTHLGQTATWSTVIKKDDEETIYALRRLSRWAGDVYVREPSGTGYWANITVNFSQKHMEKTIPVSFTITRVEGGA